MGCCGGKKDEVDFPLKHFPPLEENIDLNIICRKYPYEILAPNCRQAPEDIKTYRVVLLGDKRVGKSQIVEAFQKKLFIEEYAETIEQEIMVMHKVPLHEHSGLLTHDINDYYDCLLRILDTAGMTGSKAFTQNDVTVTDSTKLREWIIKGHIFVIVFDLTNKESFENVVSYLMEISKCKQIDNAPIILVGNKSDLVFNDRDKGQFATYADSNMHSKTASSTMNNNNNGTFVNSQATTANMLLAETQNDDNAGLLDNDVMTMNMDNKNVIKMGMMNNNQHPKHDTTESVQTSAMTIVEHNSDMDQRQVSPNEIFNLCNEYNIPYVECSAKIPYNINTIFNVALKESLLYQEIYGKDMRSWMRIKRTMSMENSDGTYSLHN